MPPAGVRRPLVSRPMSRPDPAPIPPAPSAAVATAAPSSAAVDTADADDLNSMLDWTDEEVAEITNDLIEWADEEDKLSDVKAARLARLSEVFVRVVEADAGIPKISKRFFKKFLPKFVARKLNEAKIDPAKSDGTAILIGILIYAWDKYSRRRTIAKEAKLQGTAPVTDQVEEKA